VLCEKPMAVTAGDCAAMINAAEKSDVRLMVAYRLHFEEANLKAIQLAQSGKLGELRLFTSTFTMSVRAGNSKLQGERGSGSLYDIGVYCINAARHLFRDHPVEVQAMTATRTDDPRFAAVEEMITCSLRFPGERLASFSCSFGAAAIAEYRIVGTRGDLHLEPGYDYAKELRQYLTIDGKTKQKTFVRQDQFAAELIHFSEAVLSGREPEPSGREGMIDVAIVEALYRSARSGKPVRLRLA
jgi:predicted dehydrogenase